MRNYWPNIIVYGLTLGLLLAALQVLHYKWTILGNAVEWYTGFVALLFTAVGIGVGYKLIKKKAPVTVASTSGSFQPSAEAIAKLGITAREMEVLQHIAQGHSNQEIASLLFVSLNTVKTHISNVLSKLGAQRRTQAILKAKSMGLLP